jgi:hypothetical protein
VTQLGFFAKYSAEEPVVAFVGFGPSRHQEFGPCTLGSVMRPLGSELSELVGFFLSANSSPFTFWLVGPGMLISPGLVEPTFPEFVRLAFLELAML